MHGIRWILLPILALTIGIGVASQAMSRAGTIAPAPRFTATAVLTVLKAPAGRAQLGIGTIGPHAFLAAMRLGTTRTSFIVSPRQLARTTAQPAWDLVFIDHRAAVDRRAVGNSGVCPVIELYLSPTNGRRVIAVCSYRVPRAYAALPAPRFGITGLLHDLRCGCYAAGTFTGHFGLTSRGYLTSLRYGRIADLFPGNPIGKVVQNLRIWALTFLDPAAKDGGTLGPPGACARAGFSLRASDGTDFSTACSSQG